MGKNLKKLSALLLALTLMLSGLPATASASGAQGADQYSAAPELPIERNGDIVSSPAASTHSAGRRAAAASFAPYFLLDGTRLTSVKDQGNYGTCWAHAAMASSESILETQGLASEPDLSEWQLAYFAYMSQNGLPTFDMAEGDSPYDAGGNDDMAVALFARGSSPVPESAAPYDGPDPSPALTPAYTLKKCVIAHTPAEWKAALMQVGALTIGYYSDDDYYFNPDTNSYYCEDPYNTNHAVTVVGWDDNYAASNFISPPAGSGAWIVKNSWGAEWGDGGFFYLSYYDESLDPIAYGYELERAAEGEQTDTYDDLGWCTSCGYNESSEPNTAVMKSVFTASRTEKLTAVGTYAVGDNAAYSVSVTTKDAGGAFKEAWSAPQSGTIASAGYTRIELASPVLLTSGLQYEVIVKLTVPGTSYPIPVEARFQDYSTGARVEAGRSYISHYGTDWSDMASKGCDASIYAFTVPASATPHTVTFDTRGGSAVESQTVNFGDTIPEPAAPVYEGLTFGGWYKDEACTARWTFAADRMPDSDITLWAKWLERYTVTFNSQGGGAVASVSALSGAKIAKPADPKRTGYCFVGWYRDAACKNAWSFAANAVSGNITLYAKWITIAQAATLSGVKLSAGALSPAFKPSVKSYTVTLGRTVGSVTITPAKAYAGAAVTINGAKVSAKTVALARGRSVKLTVKVTYGGITTTYILTVKRSR